MTYKISLITAAGIAALALAASSAFAQAPPERRGLSDFELSAPTDVSTYRDAFERAAPPAGPTVSSDRDAFERGAAPAGTAHVATTSSGSGIEWPQIGAGFAVGILLTLALVLSLRYARVRTVAH